MERHVRVSFLKVAIIKGPAKLLLRKFSFKIEVSVVLQITGHSKNGPLKGAMSPNTHGRANENKLEKDSPTFSSCVGDFGRLFLSV